jgi:hypothetical protein
VTVLGVATITIAAATFIIAFLFADRG